MLRQSGNAPRCSLLLMSGSTTRSDGWTSRTVYCLKPSPSPPAVAPRLHLGGEAAVINAISAGISGRGPRSFFLPKCSAHIAAGHSRDIDTLWSDVGKKKNHCIEIENHGALASRHVCAAVQLGEKSKPIPVCSENWRGTGFWTLSVTIGQGFPN